MASNPSYMDPNDFLAYLGKHYVTDTKQRGNEVWFPCPHGCDDDRRPNELHCSFNCEKCVFHCVKCDNKGNFITLLQHFGDYDEYDAEQKEKNRPIKKKTEAKFSTKLVRNLHEKTRESVRDYFHSRGINDASIDENLLGAASFYKDRRIMIPIFNKDGEVAYVKLRRMPESENTETVANAMQKKISIPKYLVYPAQTDTILVGEDQLIKSTSSDVLLCEGELDRIIAIQEGVKIPVVTGGCGAQAFKDSWIDQLQTMRNIYICMDRDEAGESGFEKLAHRLSERIPKASIYKVSLPFEPNTKADLTDYFVQKKGTADELFSKYSEYYCGAKPIDPSRFKEMTAADIANVLDSTIKHDYTSKVITFLAMLLAYTDSDQLNIMFNASSSTGKSFICHEVSKYFPAQDVNTYGKTTPTAFFYSKNLRKKDPKTGETFIDLARRIMVFVEQPDTKLQENLRAILSHEKKRIPFAITNQEKSGKRVADEGYILGYPSTFFCSANMSTDEQEQTRCIILSPESDREKVLASINAYVSKSCHRDDYDAKLHAYEARNSLMERILYIKSLEVGSIDIDDSDYLKQRFIDSLDNNLPPKAMREISKVTSLAKAMALINAPFRMSSGRIVVTRKDIDEAIELWKETSRSMLYGLSPQLLGFYENIVLAAWKKKISSSAVPPKGLSFKDLTTEYYDQMGSLPSMDNMRKQWIPVLESAGFIKCVVDNVDNRLKLIVPQQLIDSDVAKHA